MAFQNSINNTSLITTRPGLWIHSGTTQIATGTQALTANTLRAFPWVLSRVANVSTIRSEVTIAVAATSYRVGIYTDNNMYPGTLISGSDTGVFDSGTTGLKSGSFSTTILPQLIWVVIHSSGTPTLRSIPVSSIPNILGSQASLGTNSTITAWSISQAFGALPTTFPAGATITSNLPAPLVLLNTV
jgi:hypothetical protein